MKKSIILIMITALAFHNVSAAGSFKRVSDGKKDATSTIQKAIDECAASGGGVVSLPKGQYHCGPIFLKSNVELHLEKGAAILGRTDFRHGYDVDGLNEEDPGRKDIWNNYSEKALISAKNAENIAITGPGIIDGRSNLVDFEAEGFKDNDGRPYGIFLKDCRNVTIKDVSILNAGFWTLRLLLCDGVLVDGVHIRSLYFKNNDGIDIDARNVVVSNCVIESQDDGICLKSNRKDFLPENITITNCIVASNCNPIKFGTACVSGWKNVTISNCIVKPTSYSHFRKFSGWYKNVKEGFLGGMSGIAIECPDGGCVENINISNIVMSGILTPVLIVLNRREGIGSINGINISNIIAEAEGVIPCMIAGLPEAKIRNVSLNNIRVTQRGGMPAMTGELPEAPEAYPENRMFGHMNPACGLFLRHVDGINVSNMSVRILEQDHRPCIYMDDVTGDRIRDIDYEGSDGVLIERK